MNKVHSESTQQIFKKYASMPQSERDLLFQKHERSTGSFLSPEDKYKITLNHQGLVFNIAKKYYLWMHDLRRKGVYQCNHEFEDLVQFGQQGLMTAIRKYDVAHESKATFNTYAYMWVSCEIKKFIRDNQSMIRIPQLKQKDMKYNYQFKDVEFYTNTQFMAQN